MPTYIDGKDNDVNKSKVGEAEGYNPDATNTATSRGKSTSDNIPQG